VARAKKTSLIFFGGMKVSFRERWTKEFTKMLTEDERKAFSLWLHFSQGKISESEFQSKMDVQVMPKMLGKMSAARMNAIEDEVENLRKRVASLEKKSQK
jgi:polyhydroxyalkanoate synthesis regulator phasin